MVQPENAIFIDVRFVLEPHKKGQLHSPKMTTQLPLSPFYAYSYSNLYTCFIQ